MKYKVCVVTGTRAEFGLLLPLLQRIRESEHLELRLVVTGSHLSQQFGNTQDEIVKAGFSDFDKVPIDLDGDTNIAMALSTGDAITKFAKYYRDNTPNIVVVLGDRYEIFAAATAAATQNVPIAHIHGGETTEGAMDEFFRHSVTKMSYLHFASCEQYRKRIIQLGESPDRVFNAGALGVENVMCQKLLSLQEVFAGIVFDLVDKKYAVVTFHPVTMENVTVDEQMWNLIAAMNSFSDLKYVITKSNADAGGRKINDIWDKEGKKHNNWCVVNSLGMKKYLSVLKGAEFMLGNSSSGILEAPAIHVPTVNIGDRQRGRLQAESIINCEPKKDAIVAAMKKAMSPEFRKIAANVKNPFGDGHISEKIVAVLQDFLVNKKIDLKKKFYDIDFEVK